MALGALPASAQVKPSSAPQVTTSGPGDLLVAPTRVVFDMRKRTAELNLSNIGFTAATYRISLVRMEMDEDGGIAEVPFDKTLGALYLPGLIRFSPREVTLGPQDSQTVRLQVRKPAELPAGEYRINLVFRGVPPAPEPPGEPGVDPPKGISINLVPVYGLSIPVIIRHGDTWAKVGLSGLTFDAATRTLRFHMDRQGNQSVYGDLKAIWIPRAGAGAVTVAEATGVAVYAPNQTRKMALVLATPKGAAAFGAGRLKVTYILPPAEGGALLAEAFLDLN